MIPPDDHRCLNCGSSIALQGTNCPNCGAGTGERKRALGPGEIFGFFLFGLALALLTLVGWGILGFMFAAVATQSHGAVRCAASIAFNVLAVGLCLAALIAGVRFTKRGRTGPAIVVMLVLVLGMAPATLCTATILIPTCGPDSSSGAGSTVPRHR